MKLLNELGNQKPPTTLYHYTTQKGLLGIFTEKKLRTSKILYLNDSSEYSSTLNKAKELLNLQKEEFPNESDRIDLLLSDLKAIYFMNVFVGSFSTEGDMLSQWRGYSDSSGGYSIGFKGPILKQEADEQKYFLIKCIYEKDQREKLIKELIEEFLSSEIETIQNTHQNYKTQGNDAYSFSSGKEFWKKLATLAAILKDDNFIKEAEWRIISAYPVDARNPTLNFRCGKSNLIPYNEFNLNHFKKLIYGINVGPTPNKELACDAAKMLLHKNDLNPPKVELNFTNIPYRNW